MHIIFFTISTLTLFTTHFSYGMNLKERLVKSEEGSYLVFEQNKTYTFFTITKNLHKKVLIEEVSVPENRISEMDACEMAREGFRNWFEKGAPGHTSWTMTLINLDNGRFEEMYSFTQKGWIDVSKVDTFMTTLFNLSFHELSDTERRHIGLPPGRNQIDRRPLWQPKLIVEGKWIPNVYFSAWKSRWPTDGSELSHKIIELYIPQEREDASIAPYPTYFPYVVEVEGKIGSAKIRVVDSGMNVRSPSPSLPLRPPQLTAQPKWTQEGLVLFLKAPMYFEDFLLLAEEPDEPFSPSIPLSFTMNRDGENVALLVNTSDLKKNTSYQLVISPKEHPTYCLQTESLKIP